ncbi:MAG: aldehyde ferredoxin oxidoreductase N-terminal domain-containing protein [Desulfosarcina sp.]|jgi:aldehyde:ferredoxin oxidoreductase
MGGYTGSILSVDLSKRSISVLPTAKYEDWVGGHGMGSSLFFERVKDKTIDGFHPDNLLTLMASPLSGTLVPSGAARTEVQGIGVQSWPVGWFTRSNFGGRFAAMLKYAGWDGIVIQGRADSQVWIDIRDHEVKIRDCEPLKLWGTTTWECQQIIWDAVAGSGTYKDWYRINKKAHATDGHATTQRPAVLAVGPAGENLSRMACLIHDAGNAAGQGGFGAVFGAKGLKAVSVLGTGSIKVHDPKALLASRIWLKKNYSFDLADLKLRHFTFGFQSPPSPMTLYGKGRPRIAHRPQACLGCTAGCRGRYSDGIGNEAVCFNSLFYLFGKDLETQRRAADLINQYGLNAAEMFSGEIYLKSLHTEGVLGAGMAIDCPLDFEQYGNLAYAEQLVKAISYRNDGNGKPHAFGDVLAEGFVRAAETWGRLSGESSDLKTGRLPFPHWGLPRHKLERSQLDWAYGTIFGDRDINEHCFDLLRVFPTAYKRRNIPLPPAQAVVKIIADKMAPFQGDLKMLDFSEENMYSDHIIKLVTWHRYYTRFWKQSAQLCDFRWPDFLNLYRPDRSGATGLAEPRFFKDVTGKHLSYLEGIKVGKRIWNLDQVIWTLQGRQRDMVTFADYLYTQPGATWDGWPEYMPGIRDGQWDYVETSGRHFDRQKFEDFKTRFYQFQGWDPSTGWPTRSTLESIGLKEAADELGQQGRLGA